MPRIRTIKPTLWADDKIAALSIGARLLTIGLISYADDDGRFIATIGAINGYVFPHDHLTQRTLTRWLNEIDTAGIITLYQRNGCQYGYFPNWERHQRINRRTPSPIPPPLTEPSLNNQ